ncbi:MAG: lipopolysaccharide biosynthesis protein [Pseudomonadota bacterium]
MSERGVNTPAGPDNQSMHQTRDGQRSVGSRVARGAAWIGGGGIAARLIGLINTLIIARLLTPDDFGVVAIGVTITQLLQNISDIGVAQTVVYYQKADRKQIDTLFTLSVLRGVFVLICLWLAAVGAGAFYNDDRVGWIFFGMGGVAIIQALVNPRLHEFQRELDFTKEVFASLADKIIGVLASIAVAVILRNYWAIVAGLAAGATARLVISYYFRPYLPRLTLTAFQEIIGFTGWLTGVSFMAALNNKIDALFLGKLLGPVQTGLYYMGTSLAWLPASEIAGPIAKALYPGLSSLQSDPKAMRETFLRGAEALGIIALPAAIGCAFVADNLVQVILGTRWADTAPIISIYSGIAGFIAVYSSVQEYAVALGQTRAVFFRETAFFLIRTPIFIWASLTFGLDGAVWSLAGLGVVHVILNGALYYYVSRANPFEPLWRLRRAIWALLAMAGYFMLFRPLLPFLGGLAPIYQLLLDIMVAAVVYFGMLLAAWRLSGSPEGIETAMLRMVRRVI